MASSASSRRASLFSLACPRGGSERGDSELFGTKDRAGRREGHLRVAASAVVGEAQLKGEAEAARLFVDALGELEARQLERSNGGENGLEGDGDGLLPRGLSLAPRPGVLLGRKGHQERRDTLV